MKKILLVLGLLSVSTAYAYPAMDMTVGGAPFMLMQQQQFQKMEVNDYKQFKDAYDQRVEDRMDELDNIKHEYEVKNIKKPAKIQLNSTRAEVVDIPKPDMQLINQDGKIQIKHTGY